MVGPLFLSPQKNVTLQCVFWVEDPTCEYEGVSGRDGDPQGWVSGEDGLRGGSDGGQGSAGGGKACRNGLVCVEGMVWSRGLGSIRISCVPLSKQPWELEQCGL